MLAGMSTDANKRAEPCKAKTRAGTPCPNNAVADGYCGIASHGPERREPYKFDVPTRARYLWALQHGASKRNAAAAAGVTRQCVWEYKQKHPEFTVIEALSAAEANEAVENGLFLSCTQVDNHGRRDSAAQKFYLTNRMPDRWANLSRVEIIERALAQERPRLFKALEAAGVSAEQVEMAAAILDGSADDADAGTVH